VSMGWCFWHGDCYGCLLCGSRVIHRGVKVRELNGRGIEEVGEVPLCWDCGIEIEVCEERGEQNDLEKRLGRVDGVNGVRTESPTLKQAVSLDEGVGAVCDVGGADVSQVRLPGCLRNNRERRDYITSKKPLGPSRFNIRANASDPVDGESIRVKQKPKIARPCHRVWSSRLAMSRFSEPG
jgi:hypothetical protein